MKYYTPIRITLPGLGAFRLKEAIPIYLLITFTVSRQMTDGLSAQLTVLKAHEKRKIAALLPAVPSAVTT